MASLDGREHAWSLPATSAVKSPWPTIRRGAFLASRAGRYLTARKFANLLLCESEKLRRTARVRSFPYIATLDVTNLCNLRCPYCPTGAKRDAGRSQRTMPLSVVDSLLDAYGPYLISANLFNWGEPFVNPLIAEIVERIHARRIFTQISSNLGISHGSALLDAARAGLDYLMISSSGASQEVYSAYHRRGRLDVVLDNIGTVVALRRRERLRTPVVELKYLLFRHNAHEVDAARCQARKAGVDVFRVVRGGGEPDALVDPSAARPAVIPTKLCHQLWHAIVVNSDGGVAPCCYLYFKSDDFADLSHEAAADVRNSPRHLAARRLFDAAAVDELPSDLLHPCLKCELVHRVAHLQGYLAGNPHAIIQARTGGP